MKQIHSFDELQPRQRIFCVEGERLVILRFLCKHPYNENGALFLDMNSAPVIKLDWSLMEKQYWFSFEHTRDVWSYIYEQKIQYYERRIDQLRVLMDDL